MKTRVPCDPEYASLIGTAVCVFAYYEWALIYLIQQFRPGFVSQYSRGAPMTSGQVKQELQSVLKDPSTAYAAVSKADLQGCLDEFQRLIHKRNALIHAHPITDHDGSQILNYQSAVDRPLPNVRWPGSEVEAAIRVFDDAACAANSLLHRLIK